MLRTIRFLLYALLPTVSVIFTALLSPSYAFHLPVHLHSPMEELIWGLILFAVGSILGVVAILLIVFLIPWSERRGMTKLKS